MKNERILLRVRALLAKAESTPYPEEAAALTAKAQELITAHAIDLALIEEQEGSGEVVTRLIFIPAPYPKEKFTLLGGVARANNARAILGLEQDELNRMVESQELFAREGRWATVVGYASDLDRIELLFTSLLVQAVNAMLAEGSQVDAWGTNRTKSFRRSFLAGYGWSVRERLEAVRAASGGGSEVSSAREPSIHPVLLRREERVVAEVDRRFANASTLRMSVSNGAGARMGHAAGERADLGSPRFAGRRPELSPR